MRILSLILFFCSALFEAKAQVKFSNPAQDGVMTIVSLIGLINAPKKEISFTSQIEEYSVLLKDSSQMRVLSKIYLDSTGHTYLLYTTKPSANSNILIDKKLYCYSTSSITRLESREKPAIEGKATDSCWLFKVLEGKMNIYSFVPDLNTNIFYMKALQIGNGTIEAFNEQKLRELMTGNSGALSALNKKNFYRAILRYNK